MARAFRSKRQVVVREDAMIVLRHRIERSEPETPEIVGPDVRVVDPAPAIARQVGRLLEKNEMRNEDEQVGKVLLLTSGKAEDLRDFVEQVDLENTDQDINEVDWNMGKIQSRNPNQLH